MKKLLHSKIFYYVLYSLLFFSVIFYFDSIPNHRVGYYIDYDLLLMWEIFPVLFIIHGVISKLILKHQNFYLPLIITGVLGFIVSLANNAWAMKSSFSNTLWYLAFTLIGIMISYILIWFTQVIKAICHHYKK